jgi:hypothetical protein
MILIYYIITDILPLCVTIFNTILILKCFDVIIFHFLVLVKAVKIHWYYQNLEC